jgi:anaerobic selenocysteine-containing dehydrogenase
VLQEDPYKIRFLLIGGASILTSFPNTALFTKALHALDYLVSINLFLNRDAYYSDLILPGTTHFEITSLCSYPDVAPHPYAIQYRKKIIEPLGDAQNSYLILARLAERLGSGHHYPQTEDDMVRYVVQDLPLDFEDFKRRSDQGPVPLFGEDAPAFEEKKWVSGKLRPDGKPGFPTPSEKWEISSTALQKCGYSPLPTFEEVREGPGNEALKKDFPLTLTTGARIQSTFRSQHLNIPGLLKHQPFAQAVMHKEDADARGIATGDRISVVTPRGHIELKAFVTRDILSGTVEVNQGGGSPIQADGWKESNVNFLTDNRNQDPISGFPVFKALLCEVKKVEA